jgi:hypothetical protein
MLTFERNRRLTVDDIADLRAYERERADFGAHVRARKARRRVPVGDLVTFTFECADTVRYQIQEMARVERLLRDEQIQSELDAYNPLIPLPGQLSATMFIELTSKIDLMHWLPLLVGVERCVSLRLPDGSRVKAIVDEAHDANLTRDDVTSSVHYLRFEFTDEQVGAFRSGPVNLSVEHDNYHESATLSADTITELSGDLVG